jgi:hypothetical protein
MKGVSPMRRACCLILCTLWMMPLALAATRVVSVQAPAWLERGGVLRPLAPDLELQAQDVLRTGPDGRVLLTLPEGSQIKLGADVVFRADALNLSDGRNTPFEGVFRVLKGAFRFTTGLFAKSRQRSIDIHVATITAGIRGTDLWGKVDDTRDLVCLLDGRINVSREGEGFQQMDEPLTFFVAHHGQRSEPIAKVDAEKVEKEWAPQTELRPGQGVRLAKGRVTLTVAESNEQAEALAWYDRLQAAGYATRLRPVGGKYQVVLRGFATAADAAAVGAQLQATLATPLSRVSR